MEDAHTQILSLNDDKNAAFFAVYDGHGGSKVAEYAGSHLHDRITKQQTFSELKIFEVCIDISSYIFYFVCFLRRWKYTRCDQTRLLST
jgi:serine/threonine protein phosphatase PrpC